MFNQLKVSDIPSQFTLLGHTYKVEMVDDLYERESCYGSANPDLKLIQLQSLRTVIKRFEEDGVETTMEIPITNAVVVETFFHELFHLIFEAIGEEKMFEDERLVNMMGKAFLEIYLSSVYDKKENTEQ